MDAIFGHQKSRKGYNRLLSRQSSVNLSEKQDVKESAAAVLQRSRTTKETATLGRVHPLLKVLASKNPKKATVNLSEKQEAKEAAAAVLQRSKTTKETATLGRVHPLLKVLGSKNPKKAAMKPEFLRYLDYMKEAY